MHELTQEREWSARADPSRQRRGRRWEDETDAELVGFASKGDEDAWRELHRRYDRLVRAIARKAGCGSTSADVAQRTWELFVVSIGSIRDSSRIVGWLATTAHREAIREMTRRVPEPVDVEVIVTACLPTTPSPESVIVEQETIAAVDLAVSSLPPAYRPLMEQLLVDESPSYRDIASTLERPIGSIGPMRRRGLRLLQQQLSRAMG